MLGSLDLILEWDVSYPNSLKDKNGQGIGFKHTQLNSVDNTNFGPNSYNPSLITLDTSNTGTLKIHATDTTNDGTINTLVNGIFVISLICSNIFTIQFFYLIFV
jgi:hypothetical protein